MNTQQFLDRAAQLSVTAKQLRSGQRFRSCAGVEYELLSCDGLAARCRDVATGMTEYFCASAKVEVIA